MAPQNPFLANWLKGAYGMELGLAPMLEQQAARLDQGSNLHIDLNHHLEQTRRHATLLRDRLERMGEDVSAIRPIDPVTTTIGHANGSGKPDTARQTELLDYVTESFEVASYRGLQSLAEILGDHETSRVCEQILADELAVTDALGKRLPVHNGHNGTQTVPVQGNVAPSREIFAALNAHDLKQFDKLVAPDYQAELPGREGTFPAQEVRDWLGGVFEAFPDLRYELGRIAANGDSTFVEWHASGTHSGPLRIVEGRTIPATNKHVQFDGVTIFRFKNDKLVHSRIISDTNALMHQLGASPAGEMGTQPAEGAEYRPVAGRAIVHMEIPAMDRRLAARFYGEMFGWEYEHMDDPVNYTTFVSGSVPGGFPDVSDLNPAGEVLFYIESDDIDDDLRRAEKLGAKTVVPRTEIPDMGYFAILSDPTGNHIGLFYTDEPG